MTEPLLRIENASVVRAERRILDDVSLTIAAGDHTAILGRNGSGKSTLVKLILHQLYPVHGARVEVFGQSPWDVFSLRRRLGFVSPAAQSDLTGEDALEVMDAVVSGFFASRGVWRRETITPAMRDAAAEALHRMGVEHLIGRSMATLSWLIGPTPSCWTSRAAGWTRRRAACFSTACAPWRRTAPL